jgi:hypothetical protein
MAESITWIALLILSAPVLLDWGRHLTSHSWAAYALVFPILTLLSARHEPRHSKFVLPGLCLAALGVTIQLWALASVSVRNGRPGFILCALGILLMQGRGHWRTLVPLLLCVPLPHVLLETIGQTSLPSLARIVAELSQASGFPALASARSIEFPHRVIYLDATDLGISAGLFGGGIAWFACSRIQLNLVRSAFISATAGLGAMLVHVTVTGAIFMFSAATIRRGDRPLRDFLVYGIVAAVFAIAWWIRGRSTSGVQSRLGLRSRPTVPDLRDQ